MHFAENFPNLWEKEPFTKWWDFVFGSRGTGISSLVHCFSDLHFKEKIKTNKQTNTKLWSYYHVIFGISVLFVFCSMERQCDNPRWHNIVMTFKLWCIAEDNILQKFRKQNIHRHKTFVLHVVTCMHTHIYKNNILCCLYTVRNYRINLIPISCLLSLRCL